MTADQNDELLFQNDFYVSLDFSKNIDLYNFQEKMQPNNTLKSILAKVPPEERVGKWEHHENYFLLLQNWIRCSICPLLRVVWISHLHVFFEVKITPLVEELSFENLSQSRKFKIIILYIFVLHFNQLNNNKNIFFNFFQ